MTQITDMLEKIRAELVRNQGKWKHLARLEADNNSPPRFSYRWLWMFARGKIATPRFTTVMALAEYLGMKIEVKPGRHFQKFEP